MKIWTALFPLTLAVVCQAQSVTYRDTLEVQIGQRAKVIFLGRDARDFSEINKYDLNLLFDQVYGQRTVGEPAPRVLSNLEAEALRQDGPEGEKRKFWQRFYINFYAGATFSRGFKDWAQRRLIEPGPPPDTTIYLEQYRMQIREKSSYGISINTDFPLYENAGHSLALRASLGFDVLRFDYRLDGRKVDFLPVTGGQLINLIPRVDTMNIFNSGTFTVLYVEGGREKVTNFRGDQLYLQFLPMWRWKDQLQRPSWQLGIGLRGAVRPHEVFNPSLDDVLFIDGNTRLYQSSPTYQYAVVFNLGYRFVNLFGACLPRAYSRQRIMSNPAIVKTEHPAVWSVGLRLGR